MPRLTAIDPKSATGRAKELLDVVQKKLGLTPNMMRGMANAPAALQGYLDFSGALAGGVLNAKVREQIALATAEANSCDYCASAHTAIGKMVGLAENEIIAARSATASDRKATAILELARRIVATQGRPSNADIASAREQGVNDAEITEVIANVALNIYTNYFNHIAQTEIDFPRVRPTAGVA